jgi:hypothetical protein
LQPTGYGVHSVCCTASNVDVSTRRAGRLSERHPEHVMLARPRDGRIEQAGNSDPVREPTFHGSFDKARREEGQRS